MTLAPPIKKDLAICIELPAPTAVSEIEEHNRAVGRRVPIVSVTESLALAATQRTGSPPMMCGVGACE